MSKTKSAGNLLDEGQRSKLGGRSLTGSSNRKNAGSVDFESHGTAKQRE
jgi:hypothetical protein